MASENQLSEQFYLQLRVEENSWGTSRTMKQWPNSALTQASSNWSGLQQARQT